MNAIKSENTKLLSSVITAIQKSFKRSVTDNLTTVGWLCFSSRVYDAVAKDSTEKNRY